MPFKTIISTFFKGLNRKLWYTQLFPCLIISKSDSEFEIHFEILKFDCLDALKMCSFQTGVQSFQKFWAKMLNSISLCTVDQSPYSDCLLQFRKLS